MNLKKHNISKLQMINDRNRVFTTQREEMIYEGLLEIAYLWGLQDLGVEIEEFEESGPDRNLELECAYTLSLPKELHLYSIKSGSFNLAHKELTKLYQDNINTPFTIFLKLRHNEFSLMNYIPCIDRKNEEPIVNKVIYILQNHYNSFLAKKYKSFILRDKLELMRKIILATNDRG